MKTRSSMACFSRLLLWLVVVALYPCSLDAGFPGLDKLKKTLDDVSKTAGNAARVVKGASGLSLEDEIALGDAVAVQIVETYGGLWKDPEATARVNLIGRVLAQYALRQDLEWRFGLLDSDAINAFSAPGGRVFITRGLYKIAEGDDELAGVLAHEIEHIDERHAVKIVARGEMLAGISELVSERSEDFAKYDEAVGEIADTLLSRGYDPASEYEADAKGRELAKVTGFAPGGLRAVLSKIEKLNSKKTEVFSTHPPVKSRLEKLPRDPAPASHG